MFFSKKKFLKLLFLVFILLLDVKKLIHHKKYAAKAQKSKNLVCLLLHKTLCVTNFLAEKQQMCAIVYSYIFISKQTQQTTFCFLYFFPPNVPVQSIFFFLLVRNRFVKKRHLPTVNLFFLQVVVVVVQTGLYHSHIYFRIFFRFCSEFPLLNELRHYLGYDCLIIFVRLTFFILCFDLV
jgi:hypothetical protein